MRISTLRIGALAALFVLGLGACATPGPELRLAADPWAGSPTDDPYARGKAHLNAGRFGLALRDFRAALGRDPGSVAALNGMAVGYDQLGRPDLARRYLERALALDPYDVATLNNLGRLHLGRHEPDAAREYLEQALLLDPGSEIVKANLRLADEAVPGGPRAPVRLISAEQAVPQAWVERTAPHLQTLVTRPDPRLLELAQALAVEPRLISLGGTDPQATRPMPVALEAEPRTDSGGEAAARSRPALDLGEPDSDPDRLLLAARADGWRASAGDRRSSQPATEPAAVDVDVLMLAALPVTYREAAATPLRLEVSNGAGRDRMAARMREHLASLGYPVQRLTNASSFEHAATVVFYRPGFREQALELVWRLPVPVILTPDETLTVDIRLRLGRDLLEFDDRLRFPSTMV